MFVALYQNVKWSFNNNMTKYKQYYCSRRLKKWGRKLLYLLRTTSKSYFFHSLNEIKIHPYTTISFFSSSRPIHGGRVRSITCCLPLRIKDDTTLIFAVVLVVVSFISWVEIGHVLSTTEDVIISFQLL